MPPCVTFSTDTADERVVTANAVLSAAVLVGKFINHQHFHFPITLARVHYVPCEVMSRCKRHRNAVSITV